MAWQGRSPGRLRGRAGQVQRGRILARDPICKECIRRGRVTKSSVSVIADHVTPLSDGGSNDDENMQGLCQSCSDEKTADESARAQGRTPKQRIGLDGWPVEESC